LSEYFKWANKPVAAYSKVNRAVPSDTPPLLELVSNGAPIDDVELRIVADDDRPCAEREVGEICVRGKSLFDGYFGREDLTRAAFLDDWYRTGDLGYTAEGELFVTGRKKDLIIIQGRNFYPSDLEAAVSELPGVSDGRVAAFGDADPAAGTEMLVVVAETEIDDEAEKGRLKLAIMNHIAQSFDCTATRVYCVPPRWMVKSTAGKVARADNFKKYEAQLKS